MKKWKMVCFGMVLCLLLSACTGQGSASSQNEGPNERSNETFFLGSWEYTGEEGDVAYTFYADGTFESTNVYAPFGYFMVEGDSRLTLYARTDGVLEHAGGMVLFIQKINDNEMEMFYETEGFTYDMVGKSIRLVRTENAFEGNLALADGVRVEGNVPTDANFLLGIWNNVVIPMPEQNEYEYDTDSYTRLVFYNNGKVEYEERIENNIEGIEPHYIKYVGTFTYENGICTMTVRNITNGKTEQMVLNVQEGENETLTVTFTQMPAEVKFANGTTTFENLHEKGNWVHTRASGERPLYYNFAFSGNGELFYSYGLPYTDGVRGFDGTYVIEGDILTISVTEMNMFEGRSDSVESEADMFVPRNATVTSTDAVRTYNTTFRVVFSGNDMYLTYLSGDILYKGQETEENVLYGRLSYS